MIFNEGHPTGLRAPFPYFGGKRRIAAEVWRRLGNPSNYVEPFAGSLAVLLCRDPRPTPKQVETVNDVDGLLVNVWRAIRWAPDAVAEHAAWPVTEIDQIARHRWLIGERERITDALERDPEWYDAKAAGWWVWGACTWIGSGWCEAAHRKIPHLGDAGRGVRRQIPHLGNAGRGIRRQIPHLGDAGQGVRRQTEMDRLSFVQGWLRELSSRLENVRVTCGSWRRLVDSATALHHVRRCGLEGEDVTAVFLDPPYPEGGMRYVAIDDHASVYAEALAWAREHGEDRRLRIAFCGYEADLPGWESLAWKTKGGFSGGKNDNQHRESVWFSPGCLVPGGGQLGLFGEAA